MGRGPVTDYYQLLGVSPLAGQDQIARAYRRRAVARHRRKAIQLQDQLALMREAFETLADPERRKAYDAALDARRFPERQVEEQRRRHEGRVRVAMARELGFVAARRGREASAENAGELRDIVQAQAEWEVREAAQRRRRELAQLGYLASFLLALLAVALYVLERAG